MQESVECSSLRLVVYYFHGNRRCEACLVNEEYLEYSIKKNFSNEIDRGCIKFEVVNFETPGNEHLVEEYNLEYPKAFISEQNDSMEVSLKELDKIWDYTYNNSLFEQYVVAEVNYYLFEH